MIRLKYLYDIIKENWTRFYVCTYKYFLNFSAYFKPCPSPAICMSMLRCWIYNATSIRYPYETSLITRLRDRLIRISTNSRLWDKLIKWTYEVSITMRREIYELLRNTYTIITFSMINKYSFIYFDTDCDETHIIMAYSYLLAWLVCCQAFAYYKSNNYWRD